MDETKRQLVNKVKQARNVLVTISNNPSVDQVAACIGLTLMLNKMGKHATAVFSGEVPPAVSFLRPEATIEKDTDGLRDFIVSLDKDKADKLRFKKEDNFVRIYITPYKTSISEEDLIFAHGDFNVDIVLALGVYNKEELDEAIITHGRILHDAVVVSINTGLGADLGSLHWSDAKASSLSEMLAGLSGAFEKDALDEQVATAFLTGIVAETERFKNDKTMPSTMTVAAKLLEAGANQQLVADELSHLAPEESQAEEFLPAQESSASQMPASQPPEDESDPSLLKIEHPAVPFGNIDNQNQPVNPYDINQQRSEPPQAEDDGESKDETPKNMFSEMEQESKSYVEQQSAPLPSNADFAPGPAFKDPRLAGRDDFRQGEPQIGPAVRTEQPTGSPFVNDDKPPQQSSINRLSQLFRGRPQDQGVSDGESNEEDIEPPQETNQEGPAEPQQPSAEFRPIDAPLQQQSQPGDDKATAPQQPPPPPLPSEPLTPENVQASAPSPEQAGQLSQAPPAFATPSAPTQQQPDPRQLADDKTDDSSNSDDDDNNSDDGNNTGATTGDGLQSNPATVSPLPPPPLHAPPVSEPPQQPSPEPVSPPLAPAPQPQPQPDDNSQSAPQDDTPKAPDMPGSVKMPSHRPPEEEQPAAKDPRIVPHKPTSHIMVDPPKISGKPVPLNETGDVDPNSEFISPSPEEEEKPSIEQSSSNVSLGHREGIGQEKVSDQEDEEPTSLHQSSGKTVTPNESSLDGDNGEVSDAKAEAAREAVENAIKHTAGKADIKQPLDGLNAQDVFNSGGSDRSDDSATKLSDSLPAIQPTGGSGGVVVDPKTGQLSYKEHLEEDSAQNLPDAQAYMPPPPMMPPASS
jgi:hypothetical protein